MSEIENGDRVRVTYEGTVERKGETIYAPGAYYVELDNGTSKFVNPLTVTVEKIASAYKDGGVYKASDGSWWLFRDGRFTIFGSTSRWKPDELESLGLGKLALMGDDDAAF